RTERKKWLGLFDGTDVVMWVMSLASYDQLLFEDNVKNRYDDAFELFQNHCHDKNFKKTEFVVFLNKFDLFEEKLASIPFTKYDPNFEDSKANDTQAVIEYVQTRHEDIFHKQEKTTVLYC
ncbi:GTP-binding alpha subunit, partial [Reticulomyxa filosa]